MAVKPSTSAEWDSNGTNTSPTTSGHKSDGWANNEIPTAKELNYWMKQVGDWTKWLLDASLGDVTIKDLSVTGSVTFTGITNYSLVADLSLSDLNPLGTGNLNGVRVVNVSPSADGWGVGGLVGGVAGREVEICNSGSFYFVLHDDSNTTQASMNVANRVVMPRTYTYDASVSNTALCSIHVLPGGCVRLRYSGTRWLLVAATGIRTYRRQIIPAAHFGYDDNTSLHTVNAGHVTTGGAAAGFFPVQVVPGTRIEGYKVYFKKLSNGTGTIAARMFSRAGNSDTVTPLGLLQSSTAVSPGYVPLGQAGLGLDVGNGITTTQYFIEVSSTVANDLILHAETHVWTPL